MRIGCQPHHPGGMAENSSAFQRRDRRARGTSPERGCPQPQHAPKGLDVGTLGQLWLVAAAAAGDSRAPVLRRRSRNQRQKGLTAEYVHPPQGSGGRAKYAENRLLPGWFIALSDGMVTGLCSEGSGASGSGARRCPGSGLGPVPRVSATSPNPAWRPKPLSRWPPIPPTLHQTVPRAAPESPAGPSYSNKKGPRGGSGGAAEV